MSPRGREPSCEFDPFEAKKNYSIRMAYLPDVRNCRIRHSVMHPTAAPSNRIGKVLERFMPLPARGTRLQASRETAINSAYQASCGGLQRILSDIT